jgi:FAD/FMN-containing dehydrogenase
MLQPNMPLSSPNRPAVIDFFKEIRSQLAASSGYDDLAVYINYAQGDETLEQIYGENKLPRLSALKREYDPKNVFRFNNPIPQQYP